MTEAEFEEFARAHADSLVRMAFLVCGDEGRSQDAAQTALERLYVRRARVREPLAFTRKVTVNACRDSWRQDRTRQTLKHLIPPVGGEFAQVDDRHVLLEAVRKLPASQRRVIVLRHWLDLTEQQTAEALGISLGTVKSHNSRALKALRLTLNPGQNEKEVCRGS